MSTCSATSRGTSLAVEHGGVAEGAAVVLERDAAEEVFRALATETRADRLHNPGLDPTGSTPCSARAAWSSP